MIRNFLNSLEDPDRPLLGPNFFLMRLSLLLTPKPKIWQIFRLFYLQAGTSYTVTGFIELYFERDNVDQMLTNLKITMLGIICIAKANSFVMRQTLWNQVLDYVTEADKYERETRDEVRGKIIDSYTKYCRKITYLYTGLICTTFFTTAFTPLMAYVSSETLRMNIRNGTEPFQHIFSSWVPFDKNSFPGDWITVCYHIFMLAWGTGVMPASDTTILVIMVFFGAKLDMLRERCKLIFGNDGQEISDEQASKAIGELHSMHVMLIKHMKILNTLISPTMFSYVIVCSLMTCASAYQLTIATSVAEKLLLAEYLFFGIAQMFMFSWHSSIVMDKNEKVMQGPYESQWWTANVRQKKSIMILTGQFSYINIFTAGPFTNLTLSTFVAMLKGAYSYFTLLRE